MVLFDDPVLIDDWHVVARSTDVGDSPIGVRLLGRDVVLWRSPEGIHAWDDLCRHRGTRLSLGHVADGCIICPYHGWAYDATGDCVRIPAHPGLPAPGRAKVPSYRVMEQFGWVWVTLGQPGHEIPAFPEWDEEGFRMIHCGPYRFAAAAPRAVENFLDVAHFPFVHEGTLGDPDHAAISDYDVRVDGSGITADGIEVWQPDPDGTGVGRPVTYTYRVMRPLVAHFRKRSEQVFSIYFAVTPVDESHAIGWMCEAMNYGHEIPEDDLRAFQDRVTAEDVPIVESQRPELLPLDLQAELHLRSDRTSIAYRRWLDELGLTFGTS